MRKPEDAVTALADLVDHLRAAGVRRFKGDLLGPDGSKVWNVELDFEREPPRKRNEES